jgi:hypothetical protein
MENFGTERFWHDQYSSDTKVLSGLFPDRESTEWAYLSLLDKGYSKNDIHLLMSRKTLEKHFNFRNRDYTFGSKVDHHFNYSFSEANDLVNNDELKEVLETSQEIPELGIVIAGPITNKSDDFDTNTDNKVGGVLEVLLELGIPEARAKAYDYGIKEGKVLITLLPNDEADAIYQLNNWKSNQGEEVHY